MVSLRMIPLHVRRIRLEGASQTDAEWLRQTIEHTSRRLTSRNRLKPSVVDSPNSHLVAVATS